ncbi:hypothetical protein L0156_30515 [bacterium]|nr:hypothetical protein [bacterium]
MQIMKKLFAFLLLVFFMNSPSYADTKTVRYVVLVAGNQAGTQITEIVSETERRVSFEFNDRGRGPKLATRLLLTPNYIPLRIETSGNNYIRAAVEERFVMEGAQAEWKNQAETGKTKLQNQDYFYITLDSVPEETGILAQALLRKGGPINLLPEGTGFNTENRAAGDHIRHRTKACYPVLDCGSRFFTISYLAG